MYNTLNILLKFSIEVSPKCILVHQFVYHSQTLEAGSHSAGRRRPCTAAPGPRRVPSARSECWEMGCRPGYFGVGLLELCVERETTKQQSENKEFTEQQRNSSQRRLNRRKLSKVQEWMLSEAFDRVLYRFYGEKVAKRKGKWWGAFRVDAKTAFLRFLNQSRCEKNPTEISKKLSNMSSKDPVSFNATYCYVCKTSSALNL